MPRSKDRPMPEIKDLRKNIPEETKDIPKAPTETTDVPATPKETTDIPATPVESELNKAQPSELSINNTVEIDGERIEIKPTKLKYFRNKTAASYNLLKVIPINEFLTYDKGVIDPDRDADQVLFDFLIAVFDSPDFVKAHYDNMTAGDIEKILPIFGRLNGIDEKEEKARKNREAQAKR